MTNTASPVRHPNANDTGTMTKRAWVLVVLNILIPGSAQLLAGSRRLGRFGVGATFVLWALAILALLAFLLAQSAFITVLTNGITLWVLQAVIVFYVVLWVILTLDTLRLTRLVKVEATARGFVAGLAVIVLVVLGGAGAYGVMVAGVTRSTIDSVFGGGVVADPIDGRYNIMLLGGDAGPDRDGLRPDSISVVSVEASTGKTTIIGIPRNLEDVIFDPGSPMEALYPGGYTEDACAVDVCYINSIYTEVETLRPELYPDAVAAGSSPGIEAMRDAVEGVLGIQIQYYVLIDMQGFAQLIDALGGITIDVKERLPIGGGVDDFGQPVDVEGWIEPGIQQMNGFTALWYARSRHGTSDYDRMERQREVQQAILQQFDPANVLTKFQAVAEAGAQVVRTDIPQGMLGHFVGLAGKAREQAITPLELVPPLIDPAYPEFDYIHQLVADALVLTPEPDEGG